ncbi:recombinase family protein [Clostridium perfringens]|nr:recombinase family protein [Clostridium perfringens]
MRRLACYIRVSSNKDDQQSSLIQQETLLREKFKQEDLIIYSDTGTGVSFNREGFKRLMYDAGLNICKLNDGRITFEADNIRKPIFDEIVVINTSRFSRNIAIIDILRVLWDYKKINVHFLDNCKNSNNPNDMTVLKMFFSMAENESMETSNRTKRGNEISILDNTIRNNSIFGWDFDREKNYLKINKKEAEIVRFIFKTALTNGLKMTAKIVNEKGYRTKKNRLWSSSTIKTLIVNPKYKGYNVRNKYSNENMFTGVKSKYVKKENWIIQKNNRIEPIISEELWEEVQKALESRCLHGNRGINSNTYDTKGKVKCKKCGSNYCRAVERKISEKPKRNQYLICSNKKKNGKVSCDAENINIGILDDYIEKERKTYYEKIRLKYMTEIVYLKEELEEKERLSKKEINEEQERLNKELIDLKLKENKILDKFIKEKELIDIKILADNLKLIDEKIKEIKSKILNLEEIESYKIRKKLEIKDIEEKIKYLPLEEMTRENFLKKIDRIIVGGKDDLNIIFY